MSNDSLNTVHMHRAQYTMLLYINWKPFKLLHCHGWKPDEADQVTLHQSGKHSQTMCILIW